MAKEVYAPTVLGGELEIVTETLPPVVDDDGKVVRRHKKVSIRYFLNGKEITRHEAQALIDDARRKHERDHH